MRYSIEPRDRIYVKGYGFMSFAKNLSNKYSQKIIDTTKNLQLMQQKQHHNEQSKKLQKQLAI